MSDTQKPETTGTTDQQPAADDRPSLWLRIQASPSYRTFKYSFWEENPVFRQVLGICSALAVTNLVKNTFVMCLAVIFVAIGSNVLYSLIRKVTPTRTRIIVQMLIIAGHVIIVHMFLQAYLFSVSEQIGAYVGLIITNCIILGRVEAFASQNGPWLCAVDGLGAGMGYSFVLLAVALPREILGFGTLFNVEVLPETMTRWNIMVMAPSGFFGLALVIWICRGLQLRKEQAAGGGPNTGTN